MISSLSFSTPHFQLWLLHLDENEESKFQDYLYNFENHQRSVNSVRFSPDGRALATASDGGVIFIYLLPPGRPTRFWRRPMCQRMVLCRLVRTTQSDIYDLAWSPSSRELCSVSVDSKVAVWDVTGEKSPLLSTFTSHSNYVQGACWDPADEFLVSQSNDRSCRVYVRKELRRGKKKRKKKKGEEGGKEGKEEAAPPTEWVEQGLLRLACREEGGGEEEEEAGREMSKLVLVASSTPVVPVERKAGQGHRGGGHGGGKREDHVAGEHAPALKQAGTPVGKEREEKKPEETGAVETEVSGVGQEGEEGRQGRMEGEVKEQGEEGPRPGQGGKPASKRTPRLHLFADETVPSFFRRPAWSPDGCLLLTPTGLLPPSGHRGGSERDTTAGGDSAHAQSCPPPGR